MTGTAEVLERSHDPSWEVRKASASALGALLPEPAAFARLVELVDDPENTAVGQQAAIELTLRGGRPGLAAVARAFGTLEDDIGYFIAGALGNLWQTDALPVLPAELRALATSDDPEVVRGAAELREYLHTD
ncbi:HEAT repeat domain-containing protein [Jatrophihabitans sp. YIM 134969]